MFYHISTSYFRRLLFKFYFIFIQKIGEFLDFKEKLCIISDDKENKLVNQFYNNLENINIELISSKSDIDDLKSNMKWDNFVILIDCDNLTSDINQLIRLIRSYLHSLPYWSDI